MKTIRFGFLCAIILACVAFTRAQQTQANQAGIDRPKVDSAPTVPLNTDEQREMQSMLETRSAREREYREALVAAQLAQARFESANNAAVASFYKLCAKHKIDPEKFELSPDGKGIRAKPVTSSGGTSERDSGRP